MAVCFETAARLRFVSNLRVGDVLQADIHRNGAEAEASRLEPEDITRSRGDT